MKKIAVLLCALAGLAVTPAAHAAAEPDCTYTDAFCAWDQINYEGAKFNVIPLGSSACVDLADHGWGERVRSAYNNSTKTASLFASTNCTGPTRSTARPASPISRSRRTASSFSGERTALTSSKLEVRRLFA
ncbi:peptidase inhibitor family I36 protein [Lentzea terrae]|uniref:peptidase inhibitor family I36 protein n=1 Tax=Lentzea terrae TaxID=2200761 RepID=UPI001300847E|nr:peptidase inhibitor family I36 protein [Lentzea terrae]